MESDDILSILRKHLNELRPIILYNIYHGIPITYEADVAMVHPDLVGLVVHPYQAVCIKRDRCTYLGSIFIPKLVYACPISIDYTNHVVLFNQLRIAEDHPDGLYQSWVTPEEQASVDIGSDHSDDLSGRIAKIAMLNDNSVRVVADVPTQAPYGPQDALDMTFRLEQGGDLIQVQGVVRLLMAAEGGEDRKQLEVEGRVTTGDEITLLAYIAKREDEIMGELDKVYRKLRKGKKIHKV